MLLALFQFPFLKDAKRERLFQVAFFHIRNNSGKLLLVFSTGLTPFPKKLAGKKEMPVKNTGISEYRHYLFAMGI